MRRGVALLALITAGSCGFYEPAGYMPPAASDVVCYDDSDCAPNGCCGEGTAIVHVSEAPSCGGRQCSGACPANGIRCGCAVPICRDGRCVAAISTSPDC